jgi:hypothetical protein
MPNGKLAGARSATRSSARQHWTKRASLGTCARPAYTYEVLNWWTAYEYRVRKELELCPSTFSDKDDRAEMARALEEVGEGMKQLAQKVRRAVT